MRFAQSWFLIGIVAVFLLAVSAPQLAAPGGPLALGSWQDALFVMMFLTTGIALRTAELSTALTSWRLHALTQGFNLGLVPLLAAAVDPLLGLVGVPAVWRLGILVTLCLPMTISSCVLLTRLAGGSEAAALTQATLGGLLGIVITPLWLLLLAGGKAEIDASKASAHLGLVVLLPVLVGQLLQRAWPAIMHARGWLNQLSTVALLINLHQVFCTSFANGGTVTWGLGVLAIAMGSTHVVLFLSAWHASAWPIWKLTRGERIAVAICGSHKTAALGIPLMGVLFHGNPDLGAIALPLVTYHIAENLIDGGIAAYFVRRAASGVRRSEDAECRTPNAER